MAHLMKHNRATCGHMFKHYERAKDSSGEYVQFSNQSIDTTRSKINYNLAPARDSQGDFVRQRCSEVRMQNRKDVNVMCSWVVTAPADLPEADRRQFFKTAYDFMADRYGGEKNVVSAYVHMDETTPHMHFAFVPIVEDKRRGGYKVSAHDAVNRKDLKTFHQDLSQRMEEVFGRDVGILNDATKEGNKTVAELKRETALQERDKLAGEIQSLTEKKEELLLEVNRTMQERDKLAREIGSFELETTLGELRFVLNDKIIETLVEKYPEARKNLHIAVASAFRMYSDEILKVACYELDRGFYTEGHENYLL